MSNKWDNFFTELQYDCRKLTYEMSVLVRYIGKHKPLSGDSIDMLGPRIADMRIYLDKLEKLLDKIESKKI